MKYIKLQDRNKIVKVRILKRYSIHREVSIVMKDIIIIGAGPAGASAGIFTAKAGKSTIVIDNNKGMTRRAWFENYYGITEISGPQLVDTGIEQLKRLGAQLEEDTVVAIDVQEDSIKVVTESGKEFAAKHLLIASGIHTELAVKTGLETVKGTEPRINTIVKVDQLGKTNINNIWAAGTVAGTSVHAVITAGDGAKVAINIISAINGERYVDHDVFNK